MLRPNTVFKTLSMPLFLLAGLTGILCVVMIIMGYPAPEWLPKAFGSKSVRKIYQLFLILVTAGILIHPNRKAWVSTVFTHLTKWCQGYKGISILIGTYSILFLWNQITSYLTTNINFLPFSFYDYMLHYFWLGKINFTGMLHWFYHANNILYALAPFWLLFKHSLFLIIIYGPLLALGALPLFLLSRRLFPNTWLPLAIAFLYLNFRYLLNLLEMNFLAEAFYPLLIFAVLYFWVSNKFTGFLFSILLVLLTKEDAPFYVLALGFFLLFFKGKRKFGMAAGALAIAYGIFLTQFFFSATDSNILAGSANNFQDAGSGSREVLIHYLTHPWVFLEKLFWPYAKIKTQLKLLQLTLYLPLLSPWYLLVLAALVPPFSMWNDANAHFVDLRFHYSAVVIPFLFFAFVSGLQNLSGFLNKFPWKEYFLRTFFLAALLLSGGNYLSHSISHFQTKTISEISKLPPEAIIVTQGHLLPYIGYRTFNMYFSGPYEKENHPYHTLYENADYYFLARSVNAYPYDKNWLESKILKLKKDPKLQLIYDDGDRVLLKRNKGQIEYLEFLKPIHYRGADHAKYSVQK